MSNVVGVMKSVFEGECSECGASTHITLVEGLPEFLQEFGNLVASGPYKTKAWSSDGDCSIDGACTVVCKHCKKTFYAEHVAVSGDWVTLEESVEEWARVLGEVVKVS